MSREATFIREQFLQNVARHEMTVLRDDGVDRHLCFKQPDSSIYWFDVITWSGRLYIGGDCGTWVFNRLEDMFQFFRSDRGGINPSYWSEKLEATPERGAEEFSEDRFIAVVNEYRLRWVRDAARSGDLTREQRRELWQAVDDEVFRALSYHGEHGAFQAANDFSWKPDLDRNRGRSWCFVDFFDHRFTRYTDRFIWNCYAIVWAIARYDERKALVDSTAMKGSGHA
ncbi:hypothetical protein ABIC63_000542 [Pseudacidovorax sp. 1753]|uniref:hypothetical protein n=1 Tax=Pseudacidovorax sp. 1753 TaxID=3156419 RepID=UPI00339395E6